MIKKILYKLDLISKQEYIKYLEFKDLKLYSRLCQFLSINEPGYKDTEISEMYRSLDRKYSSQPETKLVNYTIANMFGMSSTLTEVVETGKMVDKCCNRDVVEKQEKYNMIKSRQNIDESFRLWNKSHYKWSYKKSKLLLKYVQNKVEWFKTITNQNYHIEYNIEKTSGSYNIENYSRDSSYHPSHFEIYIYVKIDDFKCCGISSHLLGIESLKLKHYRWLND